MNLDQLNDQIGAEAMDRLRDEFLRTREYVLRELFAECMEYHDGENKGHCPGYDTYAKYRDYCRDQAVRFKK